MTWVRGPAQFSNGWIALDRARSEMYYPLSEADLVFDLVGLFDPYSELLDNHKIVPFVRKYGLLWSGPESETSRERVQKWAEEVQTFLGVVGQYQIVQDAIQGDNRAIASLWEWEHSLESRGLRLLFENRPQSVHELLIEATQFIAIGVSLGLKGTEERVEASALWEQPDGEVPGTFVLNVQARSLLALAYHEFAMMIVNRVPISHCAECKRFFVVADPRQQYCSKACGGRARTRRWAIKKRDLDIPTG